MNRYSKALKQLKSTDIDSKIKKLEEAPTNNTKGVYSLNPSGYRVGPKEQPTQFFPKDDGTYPDGVPGTDGELVYTRPAGYWDGGKNWESVKSFTASQTDIGDDGKNTDGLIDSDGTVKTFLPDGSRGFVLGPLTDGFVLNHTSDAYTNIGYLQKDTREFVLLAKIDGQWESGFYSDSGSVPVWDGTATGFTAHNENFTLAMAQWMRTEILANRYFSNLPYFYSGGVPQGNISDCPSCPSGMKGGTLVGGGGNGGSLSLGGQSGKIGQGSGDDVTTGDQHTQGAATHGDVEDAKLWGQIWDDIKGKVKEVWDDTNEDLQRRWDRLKSGVGKFVTDIVDADNAIDYNAKLAVNLGLSIISGKRIDIPLSENATQDLVNNIDPNALMDALTINQSTPTTGKEAVFPTGNKTDKVVKGPWGAQGGLNFNWNTKTGELEIVSNKTLRTTSGGESIRPDGTLTDIPEPSKENVQDMASKLLSTIFKKLGGDQAGLPDIDNNKGPTYDDIERLANKISDPKKRAQFIKTMERQKKDFEGVTSNETLETQLAFMRSEYDKSEFVSKVTDAASHLMSETVQASAGTAIGIRKALQLLEIKTSVDAKGTGWFPFAGKSDVEKVGGAYGHVTSTAKVGLDDLPEDLQNVIRSKFKLVPGPDGKLVRAHTLDKKENYKSQGNLLAEDRQRILREIKKPFEVPEPPKKYKMNFKGKFTPQNTPDKTASKESDGLAATANMRGHKWSQEDKYWAGYETTETMNVIYDKVGHGEQAWNRIIEGARQKNGWRNREIIEHLNIIAHEKASRKVNPDYQSPWVIQEASPEQIEKEKNFDKVNKIKQIIGDTKRGDIKPEYPDEPAVKLAPNGYHPNYGKKYKHDKLDPDSAEAMPTTGNPEIDANVKKASDVKRKARKLKTLLGKMR